MKLLATIPASKPMTNDELTRVIVRLRATLALIGETAKMQMDDIQRETPFTRRVSHPDDQTLFTHIYEYAVKGISNSNVFVP